MSISSGLLSTNIYICIALLISSCDCVMSDQEKRELANNYINDYKNNIVGSRYGGGENIYHEINAIEYDCSATNMKIGTIIRFTGQFSGTHYWVKGIVDVDTRTGNYTFREMDKDRDLAPAMKIQDIIEDAAAETLNNLFDNKTTESPKEQEQFEEMETSTEMGKLADSTRSEQ